MVAAHPPTRPILVGEWGYNQNETPYQAEYATREWLTGLIAQVPLTVYYHWKDNPTDVDNYGIANRDGTPRPSYYALRFASQRLANSTFVQTIVPLNPSVFQYRFRQANGKDQYVVFTDHPQGNTVIAVTPGTYVVEMLDLGINPPQATGVGMSSAGPLTVSPTRMPLIVTAQ